MVRQKSSWIRPSNMIAEIQSTLKDQVDNGKALIAFSGGIDSTTLSTIAGHVLGERLRAMCIDGGQLRANEINEVRQNAKYAGVHLDIFDALKNFMYMWNSFCDQLPDPEHKRKLFRNEYQICLSKALVGTKWNATHFIQGTLAPDMIESGQTGGDVIKTHHNIGVKIGQCVSLHPLSHLFKYEVRALAESIGLPESVTKRQPFSGPGLFIRVVNGWPTTERLETLRWADKMVTDLAKEYKIYDEISQLVVGHECGRYVGVKGDERTYGHAILVRGVKTIDFMTAGRYRFPDEFEDAITAKLTKHPKITRVFLDITPKPPGTIEFE